MIQIDINDVLVLEYEHSIYTHIYYMYRLHIYTLNTDNGDATKHVEIMCHFIYFMGQLWFTPPKAMPPDSEPSPPIK